MAIYTNHLSSSTLITASGSLLVSGSSIFTGSVIISGSSTFTNIGRFHQTGSVNITGSVDVTGSLMVNGIDVSTGTSGGGNYATLQSDLEIEADFRNILYGPITVPSEKKIKIKDTGRLKIIDWDDWT